VRRDAAAAMAARGAERYGVHNSPARRAARRRAGGGPPLSGSPGPPAGATAEVGIVKFDRPPPPAHPTPQSGSGQAGSDCARPGKTGLRVAEGPGQRLRVSGDLNLRVPGLLPKSRRAQATPLASSRSAGLGPPAGSLPFFGPESRLLDSSSDEPGPRGGPGGTECLFVFCSNSY
jgi:hypothetical protein